MNLRLPFVEIPSSCIKVLQGNIKGSAGAYAEIIIAQVQRPYRMLIVPKTLDEPREATRVNEQIFFLCPGLS